MFLLCHPSLTAINLSYTFPILETSATALCGTTGMIRYMYILCIHVNVDVYMIKMIYAKCTWIFALKVNWSTCSQICPGDQLDLDDLSRKPPSAALAVNLKGGRGGCKGEIQICSNTFSISTHEPKRHKMSRWMWFHGSYRRFYRKQHVLI